MKILCIFSLLLLLTSSARAQAIGVGTNSPASSSVLDVTSTNKGMLIPRMASAQRAAIASPVLGLLVFDTDTKTMWTYDGTAWKNLYTSGGLVLPFASTVNLGISAFNVGNQGLGAAIEGSSSAEFGTGMTAKATGAGSWGLYAFTNGSGAKSINAFADNGTAIHGENNNVNNTNTLFTLQNRGIGKTATFQLTSSNSTAVNVQIAGNNLAEQLKIFQTNAANAAPAVSIVNSGTGEGLQASSTSGAAIEGISGTSYAIKGETSTSSSNGAAVYGFNAGTAGSGVAGVANFATGYGVKGESNFGTGVSGYSGNNKGIYGSTISGIALYGYGGSGYALETVGKVKIAGGNTNPSEGAVLTSDATGNATWQQPVAAPPKVGFRCYGTSNAETNGTANNAMPHNEYKKVEFNTESFDSHGDFTPTGGGTSNSNTSTFLVPFNGVYHFDATVKVSDNALFDYAYVEVQLKLKRAGTVSTMAQQSITVANTLASSISVNSDFSLIAGDRVWVEFKQHNYSFTSCGLETSGILCYFSGHMIYLQ